MCAISVRGFASQSSGHMWLDKAHIGKWVYYQCESTYEPVNKHKSSINSPEQTKRLKTTITLRLFDCVNLAWQISHSYGFSPVWMRKWRFNLKVSGLA